MHRRAEKGTRRHKLATSDNVVCHVKKKKSLDDEDPTFSFLKYREKVILNF